MYETVQDDAGKLGSKEVEDCMNINSTALENLREMIFKLGDSIESVLTSGKDTKAEERKVERTNTAPAFSVDKTQNPFSH